MNPLTYDTIAPNIAEVELQDVQVRVRWKCPLSGREIAQSSASLCADPSLAARVQASVKRSVASEIIYGIARLIGGALGGAAGRVVSQAAYTAANDLNQKMTAGADYTEASRQQAIVAAFDAVRESFVWDEQQRRFVARP